MNPITLCFADHALERRYRRHQLDSIRKISRVTIPLSGLLFATYGIIELFIHEDCFALHAIRFSGLASALALFALTWHPRMRMHSNVILSLITLIAAASVIAMYHVEFAHGPEVYFDTLIIVLFWSYTLIGLQYAYALPCGLLVWLGFALVSNLHEGQDVITLVNQHFCLMITNLLAALSAYARERQSRKLFLRECHISGERDSLRNHATRDELTGLLNRRALLEHLDQVLDIRTQGVVQAALFIDLDGFKPINDRHGHAIGDEVLRIIGERLGSTLRGNDIVGRLGGDEFLVLISREGNGRKGPEQLAERLIDAISRPITLEVAGEPLIIGVSASIGICLFPFSGATPETVIARADSAMYEAKQRGRGRVVSANPLRLVL